MGKFHFIIQKTGFKLREREPCAALANFSFYHFQTPWHAEKKMWWDTVVTSVMKLLKMCSWKASCRKVLITLENWKGRAWNVTLPKCHRFFLVLNLTVSVFWVCLFFFFLSWFEQACICGYRYRLSKSWSHSYLQPKPWGLLSLPSLIKISILRHLLGLVGGMSYFPGLRILSLSPTMCVEIP